MEDNISFEEGIAVAKTLFDDLIWMDAKFYAPVDKVMKHLPTPKLKPAIIEKNRAQMIMAAIEYRKWGKEDLHREPYNEWTVMIPVEYNSGDKIGLIGRYVLWMPVNSEPPMKGGIEGWGFNKFMAEINFKEDDKKRTCDVTLDGKKVISFKVHKHKGIPEVKNSYVYTVKDNKLIRTLVQLKGNYATIKEPGLASYILGNHPIAQEITALELDQESSEITYGTNVQANLHLPSMSLDM